LSFLLSDAETKVSIARAERRARRHVSITEQYNAAKRRLNALHDFIEQGGTYAATRGRQLKDREARIAAVEDLHEPALRLDTRRQPYMPFVNPDTGLMNDAVRSDDFNKETVRLEDEAIRLSGGKLRRRGG
jgi:hypothetical protein